MRHILLAGMAALAILAVAAPAGAQVSEGAAQQMIEKNYDVKVLRVRDGEAQGRPVWLVTVMSNGGNYNDAFQVNTLAVDKESGALVPSFRNSGGVQSLPPVIAGAEGSTAEPAPLKGGAWP